MKVKHKAAAILVAFASVAGIVAYYGTKNDGATHEVPSQQSRQAHELVTSAGGAVVSLAQYPNLAACNEKRNQMIDEAAWVTLARQQNPQDAQNSIRLAVQAQDLKEAANGQLDADVRAQFTARYTCRPL